MMMMEPHAYFGRAGHPLPEILPEWRPFFDGCRECELRIEQCAQCGHRQFFPRGQCTACGGQVAQLACSGTGTIYSMTTVRFTRDPFFSQLLPYVLGTITLPEGVTMTGMIVGADPAIGGRVTACFGELAPDSGIWAAIWQVAAG